jgi:hypothetical protein
VNRQGLLAKIVELTLVALLVCACAAPQTTSTPIPIPDTPKPEVREGSALSLEEATQLVLAAVVKPDVLDHEVIVFPWPEPLRPGDRIQSYLGPDLESPGEPFPIDSEAWFFWVDDLPGARFVHPTRFVFVDRETGEVSPSEEGWWPVLNGESLWVETEVYWDEANWAFSNVEWRPSGLDLSLNAHGLAKPLPVPALQDASPGAALVVNGWSEGQSDKEGMQVDATGMRSALIRAGFDTDHFDPPHTRSVIDDIYSWIHNQANVLEPCQTVFLYIVGHGAKIGDHGFVSVGPGVLGEPVLDDWLEEFKPGVHVIVIIDACHSGAFINGLKPFADIIITSCGADDQARGDIDPKDEDGEDLDKNPEDIGGEFTSGFIEDWDEIMDDPAKKAQVKARAQSNNENFWQALVAECWITAVEKDAAAAMGKTSPQLIRGVPRMAASTPTATPTATPTSTPTATPSPVTEACGVPQELLGDYWAEIAVLHDPAGHEPLIGMPDSGWVRMRCLAENRLAVGVGYMAGWVYVYQVRQVLEEAISASSLSPVDIAGLANAEFALEGTLTADGLTADYTVGGLPGGESIVYRVEGTLEEEITVIAEEPLVDFSEASNAAFQSLNATLLESRLHPAAFWIYGEQCQDHLETAVDNPVHIEILGATELKSWTWVIDGLSIDIDEKVYEVDVLYIAQGETGMTKIHLAVLEDGSLAWFTDCGDPLPTIAPPSTGTTATLMVINYCGAPLYFTIAGTMYEVPANSHVWIEVPAGEQPYTVSMPGRTPQNLTGYFDADTIYGQQITCCQDDSLGTRDQPCR